LDLAIYVRVSSDKQVKGFSLEAQKKSGITIAEQNEWTYEVFEEAGRSAQKETLEGRPALTKILELAEEGKVEYCFVTELDRLARNPATLAYIKKVFTDSNVKVVTPNQTFDFTNDEDDFISDLLGLLAKRENRLRVKRIKRAKLEAALKGRWKGGVLPLGYKVDSEKRLIPDPEERKVYNLMVKWYLEGKGTNVIARKLIQMAIPTRTEKLYHKKRKSQWKGGVVLDILKNSIYKGEFHYEGNKIEVPSLISAKKWDLLQEQRSTNWNNAKRNTKRFYLLRGLLCCKKCGRKLFGMVKPKKGMRCYCCLSKRPDPLPRFCGLKNINLDRLNQLVWNATKELVKDSEKLREAIENKKGGFAVDEALSQVELESVQKAVEEKNEEIDRILDLYGRSKTFTVEELDKRVEKLKKQREDLERESERIESKIREVEVAKSNFGRAEEFVRKTRAVIDSFTDQEKRDFLVLAVDKIWVDYDEERGHTIEIEGAIPTFDEVKPGVGEQIHTHPLYQTGLGDGMVGTSKGTSTNESLACP